MKLNLACGFVKKQGFVNIDNNPACNPDRVHDLLHAGIPYNDDSIDEIVCEMFLEHLKPDELIRFINQCHRVLKDDGLITFLVPNPTHRNAHIDPTHIKFFTINSLDMFVVPDYNSLTAGVSGWWKPNEIIVTKEDFTFKMSKVSGSLKEAFDKGKSGYSWKVSQK